MIVSPGHPTTRRQVLGLTLFAGLFMGARDVIAAAISGRPTLSPLQSLPAFLDTLLPEDSTPSATQLGVDRRLTAMTMARRKRRLLIRGCLWLDAQAKERYGQKFHHLGEAGREAIVASAATAPKGSLPHLFFNVFRVDAFNLYYSDAKSWPAFSYEGPPQPSGFPDHSAAPGERG